MLTKPDLTTLFAKNPRAARRIIMSLLGEMDRKHRLQMLMMKFVIASLQSGTEVWAVMIIQKAWKNIQSDFSFVVRKSARKHISQGPPIRLHLLGWSG